MLHTVKLQVTRVAGFWLGSMSVSYLTSVSPSFMLRPGVVDPLKGWGKPESLRTTGSVHRATEYSDDVNRSMSSGQGISYCTSSKVKPTLIEHGPCCPSHDVRLSLIKTRPRIGNCSEWRFLYNICETVTRLPSMLSPAIWFCGR